MIHLNKEKHCFVNDNGDEYISVTKLLAKLFPFNAKEIAERVNKIKNSKYFGMGVERILEQWNHSSHHGHDVHGAVENFIKKDGEMPTDKSLLPLMEQFKRLNFKGQLTSEVTVYDDRYRIAGIADILEDCGDKIYVWDIKTYNKITDDRIHKVSLQLEIYRRLVEFTLNKKAIAAGALIFEDFVVKRKNTRLKVIRALPCIEEVDGILENRLREIA